jgi:thioesterase domain-containing protein
VTDAAGGQACRSDKFAVTLIQTANTLDMLSGIWRRLLKRSSLSAHENFFDLGGDPGLAIELFAEIARVYGRDLPPTRIYQAPTLGELASLMEHPEPLHFPPLVLLKSGTEYPPIFIAHGLGGSVMELFQLVRNIEAPNPIYGMQASGLDGARTPFDRIEDMAQFYLDSIKGLQPEGPYYFIGYSLGGLVVLEIAQRLSAMLERVGLLVLVDSYPYRSQLSTEQQMALFVKVVMRRASKALRLFTWRNQPSAAELAKAGLYSPPAGASFAPHWQRVHDQALTALKRYQPRPYAGRIQFIRAAVPSRFPDDPAAVWTPLAPDFHIDSVPGDHLGMLTVHFEALASVLNRHLKATLCAS